MSTIGQPRQESANDGGFALDQPPHVQIAEILILPLHRYRIGADTKAVNHGQTR
ncbi:hypothetical protein SAMN05444050_6240 [Afipia sp. GAS231]|nr:hypothetical protein SAMN05444050_6240 [Afipia sp. GAS231]